MAREEQSTLAPPEDLEHCLCVTRNADMADVDHLCCGTAGRGLFLVRARISPGASFGSARSSYDISMTSSTISDLVRNGRASSKCLMGL